MFFDYLYEIGGQNLVDAASNFLAPIYEQICDLGTNSWVWDAIAQGLEHFLS